MEETIILLTTILGSYLLMGFCWIGLLCAVGEMEITPSPGHTWRQAYLVASLIWPVVAFHAVTGKTTP